MYRRDFLKTVLASSGALAFGATLNCVSPKEELINIFPKGNPPKKLWAIKIPQKMNWHEKNFITCLQGLINKNENRIYLIHSKSDRFWLDYYKETFDIDYEILENPDELVYKFADEIFGYILYEKDMPHSLNLATTMGSLQNAVPVSKNLEAQIKRFGLKKIDDLCGRWENMYVAYEWALEELVPKSNQKLIGNLCVHDPHWPTSSFANRDYIIAHNVFSVDISSSERDKRDYQLLRKVYQNYPEGAVVVGWHCVRDKEHEAIALQSEFGHYGMCSLRTANLTVHSSIQLQENQTFKQRKVRKKDLKVEDKVYIAYMATDGDAAWFVQNLINTDWANPLHGEFKYNWGFLPMAYDLMPGMVKYYFENMKENDYFVAGPAGATYTYPHLLPQPEKFLRLSNYYMKKCGLTTVHMTNWNDRDWWQEVDLAQLPKLLRKHLPDCVGYVRGMGESAFEKHYLKGGNPYVFCGEGIHKGNDIYQVMKDFIDACPNRPLFIYNLVNHSIPMNEIKEAMDKFPQDKIELVHLDELLLLIEKAFDQGKISEDLYPEKEGLQRILANETSDAWPDFFNELQEFQLEYENGATAYIENVKKFPIGLEFIVPGEILAFGAIWHGMKLVKLSLEAKGIYVNHKPTATSDFIREFRHLPDVNLVRDLQKLWNDWHQISVSFTRARQLADRLLRLAREINHESSRIKRA
jgi:hypothetical protein